MDFKIGAGSGVRFWWCGNSTLKFSFTSLYDLAVNKIETVAEAWIQTVGNGSWELKFMRPCNNWEVYLVVLIPSVIQKERVILGGTDKIA